MQNNKKYFTILVFYCVSDQINTPWINKKQILDRKCLNGSAAFKFGHKIYLKRQHNQDALHLPAMQAAH